MKNVMMKGLQTGAAMGGLILLSFGIVPACSSSVSIVVGILLATITGSMWFPARRRSERQKLRSVI